MASVAVSVQKSSLILGETTTATAVARDASGNVLSNRAVSWSSSNSNVLSVNAQGQVGSVGVGSANVVATIEQRTGSSAIAVAPVPIATISVSLASSSLSVGSTTQATATPKDANGAALSGRSFFWSSDNTDVATVTQSGLVTAVAVGTANISAASEGQQGETALSVTAVQVASVAVTLASPLMAPGSRTQVSATPMDAKGVPVAASYALSSDNSSVATVTPQGVVTAVGVGTANIVATSLGTPGSAPLTVAVATGYSAGNQKVNIVDIGATLSPALAGSSASATSFTSRAPSVATVDAQGLVTGVGEGQTWIAATASGFAPDSIYVIVPRNAAGPILRSDLTSYLFRAGTAVTVNVILDTRTILIGGAELSVGYTTSPIVFLSATATAMGTPAPIVSRIQDGVFRVSLASGTPLSGQLIFLRFTFTAPVTSGIELLANRSGFLILTLLDIVSPTGTDLLPSSISTRYPIIIQ